MCFSWGFPCINDLHKAIFAKANVLRGAVIDERPEAEIAEPISDLNTDVVTHFEAFTAPGVGSAKDHVVLHRMLLVDKAVQFSMAYSAGTLGVNWGVELFFQLSENRKNQTSSLRAPPSSGDTEEGG